MYIMYTERWRQKRDRKKHIDLEDFDKSQHTKQNINEKEFCVLRNPFDGSWVWCNLRQHSQLWGVRAYFFFPLKTFFFQCRYAIAHANNNNNNYS